MALSAPLLTRKRVISVKLESTKGEQIATDQAILVFDLAINPTSPFEPRKGTGLYRGDNEIGVLGEGSGACSFTCEMRGSGSSGMEPGLAILLQACGLKKTLEVYQVHSTHSNDETITIDVWEDGVKKSLVGCSGNVTFDGETGKRMMCNFEFIGRWIAPTDDSLPAYVPSTTAPMLLQAGVFTLATESIMIGKFSLNMGNNVVLRMDIDGAGGIAYAMITDYEPLLSIDPEADLVAGYDYHGVWLAGTEAAVSLAINDGTDKVTIALAKVQYRDIKEGDREGIQIYDITGQCNHSSGDDSVIITASAA